MTATLTLLALAPAAEARPSLTRMCNSDLIVEAGSTGSGSSFEVSSRPRDAARDLDADGGTDLYWNDMWDCVNGGYRGAGLSDSQGESLYQQLWCHINFEFGGQFGGDTWDLEARRPPIPWDQVRSPRRAYEHECNWDEAGNPSS
ncbi:MAG: DUF2599 domain-containing protein [Acidimicrobiia bacterium]